MKIFPQTSAQIQSLSSFQELISTPFRGEINAICWSRKLSGNFSEIIEKLVLVGNMMEVEEDKLRALELSENGNLAREIILNDMKLLEFHGASPTLNIIKNYERDDFYPFFPTDVYSFHVDRSPIPSETYLCTYFGDSSEIVPNSQAIQKVLVPEIRSELKKLYQGEEAGFESFLIENFFDLHYQTKPEAQIISLGIGHLWKLAIEHPKSAVLPCLHRAPKESNGKKRLLLIC